MIYKGFIPANKAVFFWHDYPFDNAANSVRIVEIDDPMRDHLGQNFENSAGAIIAEWLEHPAANPKAIFDDFNASEPMLSATDEQRWHVKRFWLLELSKINECGWAREAVTRMQEGKS